MKSSYCSFGALCWGGAQGRRSRLCDRDTVSSGKVEELLLHGDLLHDVLGHCSSLFYSRTEDTRTASRLCVAAYGCSDLPLYLFYNYTDNNYRSLENFPLMGWQPWGFGVGVWPWDAGLSADLRTSEKTHHCYFRVESFPSYPISSLPFISAHDIAVMSTRQIIFINDKICYFFPLSSRHKL